MRTLLENITFVKGVEYLIVVAFCLGFIVLWLLVNKDRNTTTKIVSILIPLSLIFGGGAIALNKYFDPDINSNNGTVGISNGIGNGISNNISGIKPDYFSINYGQAIEFHNIMSEKVSCTTCHHNGGKQILPCKNCHGNPFNSSTPDKPGLKAAYHQRCMDCHRNKFNGPDSCRNCHTGKTVNISVPILHKLTWENCSRCHTDGAQKEKETKIVFHDNCLSCHSRPETSKDSTGRSVMIPDDHAGRASNTCQGCHKQAQMSFSQS